MFFVYLSILFLTGLLTAGDVCLKEASAYPMNSKAIGWMVLTALLWSVSIYGWYLVLRHVTLFQVGVVFSMMSLLIVSAISIFWYKETVSIREWFGLAFAFITIFLMAKYS